MSRLDEVDIAIYDEGTTPTGYWADVLALCRTLAAEVDELRGKLDDVRMGIGCARGQRSTQFCAEAAQRDEVITKLLDLTAPHVDEFGNRQWWQYKRPEQMHARACEIAGRTE